MPKGIFEKPSDIRPTQLAAVADRRFDDARALCDTGDNARANGAQYLAGIVIEVLLKAQLMRQHRAIARQRAHAVGPQDRPVWNLIWRSHDLVEMLDHLPSLKAALIARGEKAGRPYLRSLMEICSRWTIYARYTTMTSELGEANRMLEQVKELKEVLK